MALHIGGLLALFAIPGLALPAIACAYSRAVFAAAPSGVRGQYHVQVRARVEQALSILGHIQAVRATVLGDSAIARRGESIVIIVPKDNTANCYYGGLADPETVAADGSLEGYVTLTRATSGSYSAWPADETDRLRYRAFAQGRIRGTWGRARFGSPGESSE